MRRFLTAVFLCGYILSVVDGFGSMIDFSPTPFSSNKAQVNWTAVKAAVYQRAWSRAEALLEKVSPDSTGDIFQLSMVALIYQQTAQLDTANRFARAAVAQNPLLAPSWVLWGSILLEQGFHDQAAQVLQHARKIQPDLPNVAFHQIRLCILNGQIEQAEQNLHMSSVTALGTMLQWHVIEQEHLLKTMGYDQYQQLRSLLLTGDCNQPTMIQKATILEIAEDTRDYVYNLDQGNLEKAFLLLQQMKDHGLTAPQTVRESAMIQNSLGERKEALQDCMGYLDEHGRHPLILLTIGELCYNWQRKSVTQQVLQQLSHQSGHDFRVRALQGMLAHEEQNTDALFRALDLIPVSQRHQAFNYMKQVYTPGALKSIPREPFMSWLLTPLNLEIPPEVDDMLSGRVQLSSDQDDR